jgi:hypothetical protein
MFGGVGWGGGGVGVGWGWGQRAAAKPLIRERQGKALCFFALGFDRSIGADEQTRGG